MSELWQIAQEIYEENYLDENPDVEPEDVPEMDHDDYIDIISGMGDR